MLYFPSCYRIQKQSKYNGGIVCCWKKSFWHSVCLVRVQCYTCTEHGVLASTIVGSQVLSCYRDSCWQVWKYGAIVIFIADPSVYVKMFWYYIKLSCKQKFASIKAFTPHQFRGLMTCFIHILSHFSHGNFSKCHQPYNVESQYFARTIPWSVSTMKAERNYVSVKLGQKYEKSNSIWI